MSDSSSTDVNTELESCDKKEAESTATNIITTSPQEAAPDCAVNLIQTIKSITPYTQLFTQTNDNNALYDPFEETSSKSIGMLSETAQKTSQNDTVPLLTKLVNLQPVTPAYQPTSPPRYQPNSPSYNPYVNYTPQPLPPSSYAVAYYAPTQYPPSGSPHNNLYPPYSHPYPASSSYPQYAPVYYNTHYSGPAPPVHDSSTLQRADTQTRNEMTNRYTQKRKRLDSLHYQLCVQMCKSFASSGKCGDMATCKRYHVRLPHKICYGFLQYDSCPFVPNPCKYKHMSVQELEEYMQTHHFALVESLQSYKKSETY